MKFWNYFDNLDEKARKQLYLGIVAAGFAIIFTLGVVTGKIVSDEPVIFETGINNSVNYQGSGTADAGAGQGSGAANTGANQGSSSSVQDTQQNQSGNTGSDASSGNSTDSGSSQKSVAEIIEIFNTSANKVKTDSVKVTKNYEKRSQLAEHTVLPKALQGMANTLMDSAFKDDTDPIVFATKDEIVQNYQTPGQAWSSQLTENEVETATITDNGTEYEIYIKLKTSVNPEPGTGVAKAVDTITTAEVTEKAPPILKDFSCEYFNCEIRCKIDKATGRTVWSNYSTPVIMKVHVEMFGTLEAQLGMCFEKDYTIEY